MTVDIHTLNAKCGGLLMTKETTLQKLCKIISFPLKCEKNQMSFLTLMEGPLLLSPKICPSGSSCEQENDIKSSNFAKCCRGLITCSPSCRPSL